MKLKSLINKKYLIENTEDDYEEFDIPKYSKETKEKQALASIMKMLKQKHIKGDLDLRNSKITSLGNLQSVDGYLNLYKSQIESLGNLKSVGGDLNLENCKELSSLGNLENVGGDLYLFNCKKLESLGNLERVDGNLYLENTKITSLENLKEINGHIYISRYMAGKINIPEHLKNKIEEW